MKPSDTELYNKTKKYIYKKYPKHSAYRSGLLVQQYKKRFTQKYGTKKSPYLGKKNTKKGLKRWFDEKWVNQRGEVGYKYKNDVYRPKIRITDDTPITHDELTKKEIEKARVKKYRKGRIDRFRKEKKSGGDKGVFEIDYNPDPYFIYYGEDDSNSEDGFSSEDEFNDDSPDEFCEFLDPEEIFPAFQSNYIFYVNECFDEKLADIMNSDADDIKKKEKKLIDNLINIKKNEVKIDFCNNIPDYDFPYEPSYKNCLSPYEKDNLLINVSEQLKANILTIQIDRDVFISEDQLKELDDEINKILFLYDDDDDISNNLKSIKQKIDIFPNIPEQQFVGIKCFVLMKNIMEKAIYNYLYPEGKENDFDNMELDDMEIDDMELDNRGGGKWSKKYKKSINCNKPKGFSQKQYCKYSKNKTHKRRNRFRDYPEFRPNLTPREIFKLGSFGGTYWRPINSAITGKSYKNEYLKYPKSWWKGIPEEHLTKEWDNYDEKINKYGVKVGTTLEFWEEKEWIKKYHPYGWVQWYCDFYNGKRSKDDERQVKRWVRTAGPNSRFRRALINLIKKNKAKYNDFSISPKIRQILQHWGYVLTEKDFK